MTREPLLRVEDLNVVFKSRSTETRVLHDVSFDIAAGETVCLVGESGSGKSMTGLALMGLVPQPNGMIRSGSIRLEGEELVGATPQRLLRMRGKDISMIFQEPMTALNPVFTIGNQIAETLRLHEGLDRKTALSRAVELLQAVSIPAPEQRVHDYPHQLSGGMRQRAMIAMALACRPKLLIADEPTTALDVTVQAQILDLLKEIQQRFGTAILLITHDMGVVTDTADRVVVMYAGRKIEEGRADAVLARPQHPYTKALIACIPHFTTGTERQRLEEIPGIVPPLNRLPPGCSFAPRCAHAMPRCRQAIPQACAVAPDHAAACWLLDDVLVP
ncbi:MAG: ABC transporter ATP-binding protein [Proteobacteria bacterium]|nr:ABC transporter ATP-binding protein [Pseudomonadota bacterium]